MSAITTSTIRRLPGAALPLTVAKMNRFPGRLLPAPAFIVSSLAWPPRSMMRFCDQRRIGGQEIKAAKCALNWRRSSRREFPKNQVGLQILNVAYKLCNVLRRLTLPLAIRLKSPERWKFWRRATCAALLWSAVLSANAHVSQAVTAPEQIRRLLQVYSAFLDYRAGQPPLIGEWGKLEAGVEILPMPPIDTRVGAKTEPVNPPPLIPRARGLVGLGAGFTFGAVLVPPVPVAGYSASLAGIEVEYGVRLGDFTFGARAFSLQGELNGPFSDPSASDVYSLQNIGADARMGFVLQEWTAYAGGGSGYSRTRLEITADGSINSYQFPYVYYFAGVSWQRDRWRLTFEQEQTEDYLKHVVLTAMLAF